MAAASRSSSLRLWRCAQAAPWIVALILVGVAGLAGCSRTPVAARHFILITVDTWRADHFDAEAADRPLTPQLSRIADSGTLFTQAHSVASATSPGVAGILTGLIPRRSGVIRNWHILAPGIPTLATLLSGSGFTTAAVVANPMLRAGIGFEHGFASYEWIRRLSGDVKARAPRVTDAALARVDALAAPRRDRLFLWVHYIDPHGPYLPPPETRALFPKEGFHAPTRVPLMPAGVEGGKGGIPVYQQFTPPGESRVSRDARGYLARYAAEVRFLDGEVARLLDGLAERGIFKDAVVVITADHGEALVDDHGYYFSHGHGLTQDQIHVPLVVRCPRCPSGAIIERPVSTVDILPTALARLGLPAPEEVDGVNLFADERRSIYARVAHSVALRRGPWKAIWRRNGTARRLFNLARDPGEVHDISSTRSRRLEALAEELRDLREREVLAEPQWRSHRPGQEGSQDRVVSGADG